MWRRNVVLCWTMATTGPFFLQTENNSYNGQYERAGMNLRACLTVAILLCCPICKRDHVRVVKKLSDIPTGILTSCFRFTGNSSKFNITKYAIVISGITRRCAFTTFRSYKLSFRADLSCENKTPYISSCFSQAGHHYYLIPKYLCWLKEYWEESCPVHTKAHTHLL